MAHISQLNGKLIIGLVLGLFLVVDVHASFSNDCFSTNPIAHDTDCTKYYACVGGKKVENVCPVMDDDGNRLYFNPRLHICDWPMNAGCPFALGCIGSCPADSAAFPNRDCALYCRCEHGHARVFKCTEGSHFNPVKSECQNPKHAKCTGIGGYGDRR